MDTIQKIKEDKIGKYDSKEIENLPEKHAARKNPDLEVERWSIDRVDLPPMSKIKNKVGVILFGEEPESLV